MITALLLLAVSPGLGGLLLLGEKGSAKSTAARGLREILPPILARRNCPFNCPPPAPAGPEARAALCPGCQANLEKLTEGDYQLKAAPFLTLPLGATEDRLLGGLDWEAALQTGRPVLSPGLLGQANRGFLYVDEINLLDDSLAHLLLDALPAGAVKVERDGLSLIYPARAALIGSANPEEGFVGPQLKDRLALTINVQGERDWATRAEIVRRRLEFEADPHQFRQKYQPATAELAARVARARALLPRAALTPSARRLVVELAQKARVAGHRADLALTRASLALAALNGRRLAGEAEVKTVAPWALNGRERPPRERPGANPAFRIIQMAGPPAGGPDSQIKAPPARRPEAPPPAPDPQALAPEEPQYLKVFQAGEAFETVTPKNRAEKGPKGLSGRRQSRDSLQNRGRVYRVTSRRSGNPWSIPATLRAAAPYQLRRRALAAPDVAPLKPLLRPQDIREKVYRQKTGRLVLFLVDGSGSIGSWYRMMEAKAAVLSLLAEAYQKRDKVGLIVFYGHKAELLLPPTQSPDLAARLLADLPCGGKTPLAAALVMAHKVIRQELTKDRALTPLMILMTDGRPNIPLEPAANPWKEALELAGRMADNPALRCLLVDTDRGHYNEYKLTHDLAASLRAPKLTLEDLRQGRLRAWLDGAWPGEGRPAAA